MPCRVDDFGESAREKAEYVAKLETALCAMCTYLSPALPWANAGIKDDGLRKWLRKWWYDHIIEDEKKEAERKRQEKEYKIRANALSKLTEEEKRILKI